MSRHAELIDALNRVFLDKIESSETQCEQVILNVSANDIVYVCENLKTHEAFRFEMLMDLAGVDFLHYGVSEWETQAATNRGFERAVQPLSQKETHSPFKYRMAVVYQLLSISHNQRLRVRAFVNDDNPIIDSVASVWSSANWYEREAFDLYGILFANHPDLRRILTDYGFIGHPFRKDFPLIGHVAVRYDAKAERVIYEPVDIEPRTLVPKIIREGESRGGN